MSKGAAETPSLTSAVNIETIRLQADALLRLLDESEFVEAAALMATTVDAIDAHMRRLPPNVPSEINHKD